MSRKKYFTEEERKENKRKANYLRYQNNKEDTLAKSALWKKNNPELCLVTRAKNSSKKRGIEFDLKVGDFTIPKYCPYIGMELTYTIGEGKKDSNMSIDRIKNSVGYIPSNVQIISNLANQMKSKATEEELISFAKGVLRIHAGIDCDKVSSECGELRQV